MNEDRLDQLEKRLAKIVEPSLTEELAQANALLSDIARGEYGDTLEDCIEWRIVKYFDDRGGK